MRWGARKRLRLGPLFFNFAAGGRRGFAPRFTSWGIQLGPWTWNLTRGSHTIDTPGPGSLRSEGRRRGRR